MLLGFANSNHTVQILDSSGAPIKNVDGSPRVVSAGENLMRQMEQLDNNRFIVTDTENRVQWQPMPADSNFFQIALQYINRQMLLSQLAPSLTFEEGISGLGLGGNIANTQKGVLDIQLDALVSQVKDQIIENIIRPLLVWNFGMSSKDGWGDFVVDATADPNLSLSKANSIMTAIGAGILPASDNALTNTLRELLGLPFQSEDEQLAAIQKSISLQAMQQDATASQTDGTSTNRNSAVPNNAPHNHP